MIHDDGDEEPQHADEQERDLLRVSGAEPHQQERDEGGRGQVAPGRNERVEEGFDPAKRAHEDAEWHRDQAGQREAQKYAVDADADVDQEGAAGQHLVERGDHQVRRRHELGVDPFEGNGNFPECEEDHPYGHTQRNRGPAWDRSLEFEPALPAHPTCSHRLVLFAMNAAAGQTTGIQPPRLVLACDVPRTRGPNKAPEPRLGRPEALGR